MKILAWVLFVFSCVAVIGLLTGGDASQGALYGIIYAGLVIAFTGAWLSGEYKK
jgi:uncharacterized membrane protein YeaQ/YmgE (transglycosylase-associated protein family)